MSDVVIRAENLGKKYLIGHEAERERYTALRDVLARSARGLARSARDMLAGRQLVAGDEVEEFWALRDVNFEIRRGEVVGIIGRNGAGKSTLLKILSRITEPSTGRVEIRGRVASLLEVGTGFHPELTGRENIFLNGAILGMTRAEIRKKFDEIVDFAGVEKFLDTPVKRYSSGMYVRLAFAVAAHLEPEILVVDEVLAVGDAEFQKKCLGKMKDVAGHGRTVLFVSHNLGTISSLCRDTILLREGNVVAHGPTHRTLERYNDHNVTSSTWRGELASVDAYVTLIREGTDGVALRFEITIEGPLLRPHIGIGLSDSDGRRIATIFSETFGRLPDLGDGQAYQMALETEPLKLQPGMMRAKISIHSGGSLVDGEEDAIALIVPDYYPHKYPSHVPPRGILFINCVIDTTSITSGDAH